MWHNNSFTAAPTRLVATADILRLVAARYSPGAGAPRSNVSGYEGRRYGGRGEEQRTLGVAARWRALSWDTRAQLPRTDT